MDWFRGRVNGLDAAGVPFCLQPQALGFPLGYEVVGCSCINKGPMPAPLPLCWDLFRPIGQKAYSGPSSANYSPFG